MPDGTEAAQVATTEVDTKQAEAVAWAKAEMKKAFEARDAAKAESKALKDAKDEAERKALEETQQFKTLYEKQQGEVKRLAELEARIKDIDEKADARIAQMADKLADDAKAEYTAFISGLDREKRLEWLTNKTATHPEVKDSPAAKRPGASGNSNVKVSEMPFEERLKLARDNPEAFKKLI
jgi:hypothetical protein